MKPTPEDLAAGAKIQQFLEQDFTAFLAETGQQRGPDSAHHFAIRARRGSSVYNNMSEREIILALVNELPFAFD